MHASLEASAMKSGKATWGYEIRGFSCFGFLSPCLFTKLCSISCHCNQCRFNRFQSKLNEKQIGREINEVIMQIFAYVSRSHYCSLNEVMDFTSIRLLMRILLIMPQQ